MMCEIFTFYYFMQAYHVWIYSVLGLIYENHFLHALQYGALYKIGKDNRKRECFIRICYWLRHLIIGELPSNSLSAVLHIIIKHISVYMHNPFCHSSAGLVYVIL